MITGFRKGDVLASDARRILFAVNSEGVNDAGFAGLVAVRAWPDLASIGPHALGELMTHTHEGRIYHAAVLHSLRPPGWARACDHLRSALSYINGMIPETTIATGESIAAVRMGAGPVGHAMGAPAGDLIDVLIEHHLRFEVWSL